MVMYNEKRKKHVNLQTAKERKFHKILQILVRLFNMYFLLKFHEIHPKINSSKYI